METRGVLAMGSEEVGVGGKEEGLQEGNRRAPARTEICCMLITSMPLPWLPCNCPTVGLQTLPLGEGGDLCIISVSFLTTAFNQLPQSKKFDNMREILQSRVNSHLTGVM